MSENLMTAIVETQLNGWSLTSSLAATKASLTRLELVITASKSGEEDVSLSGLVDVNKQGQANAKTKEAWKVLAKTLLEGVLASGL